jgi:predicted P-loop ATPase
MKNQYHPVRDYLDSLHWDGIPRVSGMFQTYHRSQMAASYLEEVATLWMVGAVARIYEPGTKFDYVIVLEGEQGLGKSTFLETLASKPWFLDSLPNLQDKDASTNIQGAWICEIAELAAMNRSTIEAVKAYLSRNVDRVRPPYGQRRIDIPRSTVFAGTTNPKHYLHDPTGSRRFWPVKVGRCDFQSLIRDRDQLWAEAAFMFHFNRPKLYPSYALEAALEGIHSERRVDDEGDEARALITAWIAVHDQVPTLTLAEYFTHGPLITMKRTRMVDLRVTAVLEDLGFVAQKVNNLKYWYYRGNP